VIKQISMQKELHDQEDVRLLVRSFYSKVLKDEMLSRFFSYAVKNNWEKHLEVMDRFWTNIIFFTGDYIGNPLRVHQTLHRFMPLDKEQFNRWLQLFISTVDDHFAGEKAELAKQRANEIARIMQLKILNA
jgi:hemoglobin